MRISDWSSDVCSSDLLIYVLKTGELIDRLGPASAEPLLLNLVRSLVYASREDLIPEFRAYGPALAAWTGEGGAPIAPADLLGLSVPKVLERVNRSSGDRRALYDRSEEHTSELQSLMRIS